MRGNDQPVVDTTACARVWRKRPYKGAEIQTTRCEGGLDPVLNGKGVAIGFRCRKCGAHHDEQRRLIKEPTD